MENFKKQYRDLEQRVIHELRNMVENSNYISKYLNEKALKVNLFDYIELTIVNHSLTFIDKDGLHYSLWADASLEDLIDILNCT